MNTNDKPSGLNPQGTLIVGQAVIISAKVIENQSIWLAVLVNDHSLRSFLDVARNVKEAALVGVVSVTEFTSFAVNLVSRSVDQYAVGCH